MRSGLLVLLIVLIVGVEASWWDIGKYVYPPCWITTEETYSPYGTFNDNPPYDNALCKIPEPPYEMGLELFLYTRLNPTWYYWLDYMGYKSNLDYSNFDVNKPTKFIIHGFTDSSTADWVKKMKDELLRNFDVNVILVNWKRGAGQAYSQSAANTRLVAAMLAEFMKFLKDQGASYDSFHLIGHSLGAQISGQAGQRLNGLVGRISGMDPAGPYFDRENIIIRLDSSDAQFVDIIHSDGEHLSKLGFGMQRRLGHADFKPEGGYDQENCPSSIFENILDLFDGFSAAREGVACSHTRAHVFFTQSIANCSYVARQCLDYASYKAGSCSTNPSNNMGYKASSATQGIFFLTNSQTRVDQSICPKYLAKSS